VAVLTVLIAGVMVDAAESVELSRMPGVSYAYVDDHGAIIAPEKFQDPQARLLNDGIPDKAVSSVYRYSLQKTIRILFHFPTTVMVDRAGVVWMNAHDSRQWFDRMTLYAGDRAETLTVAGAATAPAGRKRVVPVEIPLARPVAGRYFLLEAVQEAHPRHAMLSLGEISLWGAPAEAAKIKVASEHKLNLELRRHFPSNLFAVGAPVNLPVVVAGAAGAAGVSLNCELTDYFGNIIERSVVNVVPGADGRGQGNGRILPNLCRAIRYQSQRYRIKGNVHAGRQWCGGRFCRWLWNWWCNRISFA
jgi:hypothetical protein